MALNVNGKFFRQLLSSLKLGIVFNGHDSLGPLKLISVWVNDECGNELDLRFQLLIGNGFQLIQTCFSTEQRIECSRGWEMQLKFSVFHKRMVDQ